MSGSPLRSALGTVMVLILALSAAYSANFAGLREAFPPPARFIAAGPIDRDPTTDNEEIAGSSLRSFPWWAPVASFSGDGPTTTESFTIDDFSLQWRVKSSCSSSFLRVSAQNANGMKTLPVLIDARCPGDHTALSVQDGDLSLNVASDGDWELSVEQQVDVPLVEPPTPEMLAGKVIARAAIYGMDRRGEGTMIAYRLEDGSTMLRLEEFFVSPNVDLELYVTDSARPVTTSDFTSAEREHVAFVPVTTGSINYEVPDSVDIEEWSSLVIYCEPLNIAYAAAPLEIR